MSSRRLFILAGALGCTAPSAPNGGSHTTAEFEAEALPAVGKLAFTRRVIGMPVDSLEVWMMNATGSGATRVTCNDRIDFAPAWSPDGQTIVFYSQQTVDGLPTQFLYLVNVNEGCAPGTLLAEGRFPSWSPDGRKIAFDRGRLGVRDVFVRNLADGTEINLTNDATARNLRADWSPDGKKLAFARGAGENAEDIYVMNADGSGMTQLTFDPAGDNAPKWSPDGGRIVFQSDRDGNDEIYIMNADGSNQTRLTFRSGNDATPSWFPDGRQIVFHGSVQGVLQLFIMNADGTALRQVTTAPTASSFPAWGAGYVGT